MTKPETQSSRVYKALPEKLQNVFVANETTQKLKAIGQKFSLSSDDRGVLGEQTGLVLLGITDLDNFSSELEKHLSVKKKVADRISDEVQKKVFADIEDDIKSLPRPEKLIKKAESGGKSDVPTPPQPPSQDTPPAPPGETPQTGYGGQSDPYREPAG